MLVEIDVEIPGILVIFNDHLESISRLDGIHEHRFSLMMKTPLKWMHALWYSYVARANRVFLFEIVSIAIWEFFFFFSQDFNTIELKLYINKRWS